MRLDLGDPPGANPFQTGHPVRLGPSRECVQSRHFVPGCGHDQLPAPFQRDAVVVAERLQRRLTLAAHTSLARPGRVVQAGVYDTAVVAALVEGDVAFLLQQHEAQIRPRLKEPICRRKAHDPAADNRDIEPLGHSRVQFEGAAEGRVVGTGV